MLRFGLVFVFLIIAAPLLAQTPAPIADGLLGGACRGSEGICDQGICDRGLGICVSCGLEGQPPCIGADGAPYCTFPSYGYRPVPLGGRGQICVASDSEDCGHIGLPACDYGDGPVCRSGVITMIRGGTAVCGACGDYGEACCPNTDIPCDYGTCQAGVCLPKKQPAAAQPAAPAAAAGKDAIMAAIRDCRLSEARSLHGNADPAQPWYDEVTRALTAAINRENAVRDLYDRAMAKQADARRAAEAGDAHNATAAFQQAERLLQLAKAQSRCDQTIAVIDEAIAINARNMAGVQTTDRIDQAAQQIGLCKFQEAEAILNQVPSGTPGRDAIAARMSEAMNREGRVLTMYDAAKNLYDIGRSRFQAGDYDGAAEALADARQGFLQARQLTECSEFRDTISEAIAVTGRNLESAQTLADADQMPQRYSSGSQAAPSGTVQQPRKIDITPPGAHPCLDPSVKADAFVTGYTLGMGGGSVSHQMKGPFICDFDGRFTVFDGGTLTNYFCKTEGQRYVDCKPDKTRSVSSQEKVDDGMVYRYDNDKRWIVVHPPKP